MFSGLNSKTQSQKLLRGLEGLGRVREESQVQCPSNIRFTNNPLEIGVPVFLMFGFNTGTHKE